MAFGNKDSRGIYLYGEDDNETNHSTLLNKGQKSVSDAMKYFSGTPAQRAALDPAPAGAMWKDTDAAGRLWSATPGGKWRRHEGAATVAVQAFTASSPVFYTSIALTLPTVITANEAIELYVIGANLPAYLTVSTDTITRGATTTEVAARLTRIAASGAITVTFGWRVVQSA